MKRRYPRYFLNDVHSRDYICHTIFEEESRPMICYRDRRVESSHLTIKSLINVGIYEITAAELALIKGVVPTKTGS